MLFRMRRWSRVLAVVLLMTAARGVPHLGLDDLACELGDYEGSTPHDESTHVLRPAPKDVQQDHCAVCHWARLLRSSRLSLTSWSVHLAPALAVVPTTPRAFTPFSLDGLPARAPPLA